MDCPHCTPGCHESDATAPSAPRQPPNRRKAHIVTDLYVLTAEPYHENSTILGIYTEPELAMVAYGPVGPCRCLVQTAPMVWTTNPTPGDERHQSPGWERDSDRDRHWSTTCETGSHLGYITTRTLNNPPTPTEDQ